jgi:hypothetical protein
VIEALGFIERTDVQMDVTHTRAGGRTIPAARSEGFEWFTALSYYSPTRGMRARNSRATC